MGYIRKMQVLLLMVLAGIMILSVPAFAENTLFYDSSVITGFEPADYETPVDTEYKYVLDELEKEFPTQLTVWLGGEAVYEENSGGSRILTGVSGYVTQTIDVTWICREDYDEDLEVFHFVPDLSGYKLAVGLEIPEITVNVLGKLPTPPLIPMTEDMFPSVREQKEEIGLEGKATLPSSYNGYTKGVLPAVRNQGSYGICWVFSSLACVEADLIHDGKATTSIDLSELHLAYYTLHPFYDEKGLNTGDTVTINGDNYLQTAGNAYYASFPLTNMLGPVSESVAPYSSASSYSPGTTKGRTGSVQVTGAYFYDIQNNRDAVKQAILDHGAVSVVFNINDINYSSTYNSYYYPTNPGETNHVVTLVGWDDNFSSSKFRTGTPSGNGAWLVRNSWGLNGYGYNGYFWLSYYDASLASLAAAFDATTSRYAHVYAYDNCPGYGYEYVGEDGTVTQTFYVDGGEEIKAIGFFTEDTNLGLKFTVSVGSNSVTKSYNTTAWGYYLIPLSSPLTVSSRSKVTVKYTITSGNYKYAHYEAGPVQIGTVTFNAAKGSDGMVVNGSNTGYDGRIKLFTNKASTNPLSPLEIDANKVLGASNEISISVTRDTSASGYKVAVYDVANNNKSISPTVKVTNSGNTTTIKISGSVLKNGQVYKLAIYKYCTVSGTTYKSNTVTTYGVPNTNVKRVTAQPYNKGVKINSLHLDGTSGTRYYIYDADAGTQIKKVTIAGNNTLISLSDLENGKLYYVYTRPYTTYNDKYRFGPKSDKVYFVPVAGISSPNVYFSNESTAVVSANTNTSANGIRVLYRGSDGKLKNGCQAASNTCSISGLSNKNAYEFYLMRYVLRNSVRHFGPGATVKYNPPSLSTIPAPEAATILAGLSGTWTFKIIKSSMADGISVLYRINEGSFALACEKAGDTCTKDLSLDNAYTFHVMQYKVVSGKKVYSPGITLKNLLGTKTVNGNDVITEFVEVNEPIEDAELYNAINDYMTEDDLLDQEVLDFLEAEQIESYADMYDNAYDQLAFETELDEFSEEPLSLDDEIDDFEPNEADFIDVPVDGTSEDGFELNNSEQKGIVPAIESVGEESDGIDFYTFGSDTEPYYGAPSFNNK